MESIFAPSNAQLLSTKNRIGEVLYDLGEITEAETIFQLVLSELQNSDTSNESLLQRTRSNLIRLYSLTGDEEKASLLREAAERKNPSGH